VQVFTSDLKKPKLFSGTDAKVYLSLMDDEDETDRIWLSRANASDKSKQQQLFRPGQVDEFGVRASVSLHWPKRIRVGHDNSGAAPAWHLKKVVLVQKNNSQRFTFMCDRWLARDQDDGQTERVLSVYHTPVEGDKSGGSGAAALRIQVRHDENESFVVDDVTDSSKFTTCNF
jgi:hypothetical protein